MRGLDASWLVRVDFLPPSRSLHFCVPFIDFESLDFLVQLLVSMVGSFF